jgi:predicted patatin/cPLA2 family phospholipase
MLLSWITVLIWAAGVVCLKISLNQRRSSLLKYIDKESHFIEGNQEVSDMRRKVEIHNVHQLRRAVLDDGFPLNDITSKATFSAEKILNHAVIDLMVSRFHDGTTPQNRTDGQTLAIAIEGGGMRGAVSAGMAAAIYALGLMDSIDVIYGSSAGALIGAYMISRQVSVDVYTDILPNSKGFFVCKKRLILSLLSNFAKQAWGFPSLYQQPGMNISFVMDTILHPTDGLRPLDMEAFSYYNTHHQKLRVACSCVDENGNLISKIFRAEDFTDDTKSNTGRTGLHACLEASMMVPAGTGAPVEISQPDGSLKAFDAFCFEPLPYRSAVEEGATHVLVLRSRPQGFSPKTKATMYENTFAPQYFQEHNEPEVAEFFKQGGQQYVYLEDHLTLEEGRVTNNRVLIPPKGLNYAVKNPHNKDRSTWKEAYVFPLTVPHGTPELPTLEQNPSKVLEAVRGGFAAAFDLLAPAIGITTIDGKTAAELTFPELGTDPEGKQAHISLKSWKSRLSHAMKTTSTTL